MPWPTEYWNRERKQPYVPHHDEEKRFIETDVPRHVLVKGGEGSGKSVAGVIKTLERIRRGMSGIMCCVDAHTLVNGVPIADRTRPALVDTLYGPQWATESFCEGRADLFRVVTESGESVVVTSGHRLLTPLGWRQLRDLRVGDLVVADDSGHEPTWSKRWPGSPADYCSVPHPCGECASRAEQRVLGTAPPLAWSVLSAAPAGASQVHACTDHSCCRPSSAVVEEESQWPSIDDKSAIEISHISLESLESVCRPDSPVGWPADPTWCFGDSGACAPSDHAGYRLSTRCSQNSRLCQQSFGAACLDRRELGLLDRQSAWVFLSSCQDCIPKVRYTQIESITFSHYGEFYDLTVPAAGHYAAAGLIHHNSPDLPHFKKSLWPEFRRWCPWDQVVTRQQRRQDPAWEPHQAFQLAFNNGATLYCGGIDNPIAWEGPNVNFAYMDEARRASDPHPLKVLTGRIRIPGPKGEPPQIWFTTTTKLNWLYDYFGPLVDDDPQAAFKANSWVLTLKTADNEKNMQDDFVLQRAQTLSGVEQLVYLDGEWGNLEEAERYLMNMLWWDACKEDLPALGPREPLVLACDAGVKHDCFGVVGISRHPDASRRKTDVAVRYVRAWVPPAGGALDFKPIEDEIRLLCSRFHVVCIVYDPWQLHDMMTRLKRDRIAWVEEFPQGGGKRLEADKQLLDLITQRRIAHAGPADLRKHLDNADAQRDSEGHKLRIVKRTESMRVDLAVAASMATFQALKLQI